MPRQIIQPMFTILALSLAATSAAAVEPVELDLEVPRPRQGYYLAVGFSMLVDVVRGNETWYPAWLGGGGAIRVGQAVNSWLDLGVSLQGGGAGGKRRTAGGGGLALEFQLHPAEPWTVRGGAGLEMVSLSDSKNEDAVLDGMLGDAYTLGVGYDLYPFYDTGEGSGAFAVTVLAQLKAHPGLEDALLSGWLGVELTWWTGLSVNQLDLSLDSAFGPD